jgi:putative SOS response-associated peptidase YedK
MYGRARLSSDVSEIKLVFGIPPERPTPNIAPSWNLAPTDPAPIVYRDAKDGGRRLEVMRWGLIPYWAKDIKIGFSTINARAEEVDTKPAFREAFRQRRCLVPLEQLLRMEKNRHRQAALRDRVEGSAADGHGRVMGKLGARRRGREFAASPSSPPRRTKCAPSSTTACPWC